MEKERLVVAGMVSVYVVCLPIYFVVFFACDRLFIIVFAFAVQFFLLLSFWHRVCMCSARLRDVIQVTSQFKYVRRSVCAWALVITHI